MIDANAQAAIRFGLGEIQGQARDSDPRGALKAQLAGPDPAQAARAFDGLAAGVDAVDAYRADVVELQAMLVAGPPRPDSFISHAHAVHVADVTAQMGWAVTTTASFRERLVWFWTNHFTASTLQVEAAPLVGPLIREAIRPHVNGNFTDMVLAVERHPAMLRYLANADSIGPNSVVGIRTGNGLNENLGRECMELHTVGLKAGYSQADVTNMSKILTGWSVAGSAAGGDSTGFKYKPETHEPGPQIVLGHGFVGGEQAGIDALTFLATYPTTYDLLARKLVTHFVADAPPPQAVARIAGVLRDSGGDLGAASLALVDVPEAWQPLTKLKTPQEYLVSALRAAPPPDGQPAVDYLGTLAQLGQPLWGPPLPNGWSDEAAMWAGSDAMMARVNWAFTYAARFDDAGVNPSAIAGVALGGLLQPATAQAMASAPSRRAAMTMLFTAPEFQRR